MQPLINRLTDKDDVELIGSRAGRLNIASQLDTDPDDGYDPDADDDTDTGLLAEPTDEDGEHDHQRDDTDAPGGHVTRSGSV